MTAFFRAALLAVLVLALGAGTAHAWHDWKTWDYNMSGHVLHDGDASINDYDDPVRSIRRSLVGDPGTSNDPKFVGLQEVCRNQFQKLLAEVRERDASWSGHFAKTVDKHNYNKAPDDPRHGLCDNDGRTSEHDFGIALLVRGNIVQGSRQVVELPHPDYNQNGSIASQRKLLCVTANLAVWVRVCVTHLDNNPATTEFQHDQLRKVKNHVEGLHDNGKRVVVMGDFNVKPKEGNFLDRMYHTSFEDGAHGVFLEVDQGDPKCRCGAATTRWSGKIDYTWVNRRDWRVLGGSVHTPVADWDHKILRGRIEVKH